MAATPKALAAAHWLERAYRRVGLLVLLSVASLGAAAALHHLSRLPARYTWFEPLRTLRTVLVRPGFPWAVLLIYTLGCWARRGDWDVAAAARELARERDVRTLLPFALRALGYVCTVILIDAVGLGADRDALDIVALVAIALTLSVHRPARKQLAREAAYAVLGSLIFLAICYCFTVQKALTFVTGRHFDAQIVGFEVWLFGVAPHRVLAPWAAAHPLVGSVCDWVYFHFFEHMALTTVLLIALRQRAQQTEYLGALALCYLIGGPIYHVLPAVGPSYFEPQYFQFLDQQGLLTSGIRSWLKFNTEGVLSGTAREVRTWGYIACLPSLHIAQEFVMLYYARGSRPAFALSLVFTLLTLLSVVVLGWHYPVDSLAGIAVAALAIFIARWQRHALMPALLTGTPDPKPAPAKPVVFAFFQAYSAARHVKEATKP